MKATLTKSIAIAFGCFLLFGFADATLSGSGSEQPTADQLLTEVHKKLESVDALQYDYLLELSYSSENYSHSTSGTAFIDFQSPAPVIGFRYQLDDEKSKLVYNGTESFYLDKGQKTMSINPKPTLRYFTGITPFYNSIVTLKKALPAVVADKNIFKSVSDTSYAKQDFYLVKLVLNKRTIERLGGFSELSTERKITYDIIIDKSNHMPVQIIQGNSVNNDFARTVFSNVTTKPKKPTELSWYYSSYTDDFTVTRKKPLEPLLKNSMAPEWQLPLFGSSEMMGLSQLKGKVVLLEFWNKNCGYCISAVPKLNALAEKFQHRDFTILGVNLHDRKEDIDSFYQKNKPNYKTVFEAGRVADEYGIGAYPMVVLLDRQSKVLYQGGIDEQAIEKLVQVALKQ